MFNFNFYKKQKNEDVEPFVSIDETAHKGVIAIADGLGGSGSFVHVLDKSYYNSELLNRLRKAVLSEYSFDGKDKNFENWLGRIFEPMADSTPDTSALWGSRIALARFALYLKNNRNADFGDENERQNLIDFIYKGMIATVEQLGLTDSEMSGQSTLPTTFAAVFFKENPNAKTVRADVVWAGDSRAYAILQRDGLKQLSKDDEDDSGAITNLFALKHGKPFATQLHFKSYELPQNSAVFVCSDGLFDLYSPIENLGVEAVIADSMLKSDNFGEFKKNWLKNYLPTRHDDCSMAFACFGYRTYYKFKKSLESRAKTISLAFDAYSKNFELIPILKGEEDEPSKYIAERATIRITSVSKVISEKYLKNRDAKDPCLTAGVIKALKMIESEAIKSQCDLVREKLESVGAEGVEKIFALPMNRPMKNAFNELIGALNAKKNSKRAVKKFCVCYVPTMLKTPKKYFTKEFIAENFPDGVVSVKNDLGKFTGDLAAFFLFNKKVLTAMLNAYCKTQKKSVIDGIFNASRLKLCRKYYSADLTAVKDVIRRTDEILSGYTDFAAIE